MSKKIKIIFFGTTDFAVETLNILKDNFNIEAVVTAEDKPAGRGLKIKESSVKIYAKSTKTSNDLPKTQNVLRNSNFHQSIC